MRIAALAIGIVLAFSSLAEAQTYDTPEALIEAFYAPYLADQLDFNGDGEAGFRSASLQGLYDADAAATPDGEMGTLDFDPYIGGQDWTLTDFEVGQPRIDGDAASIDVTFKNFGDVRNLTFELVMEDGGWKINDLVSKTPGDEFQLSEIFILAHSD